MIKLLIVLAIIVVVSILGLVGCKYYAGRSTAATLEVKSAPKGKVAILFYSHSRVKNTGLVAQWIQKHTGGDIYEIEMGAPYPEGYLQALLAVHKDIKGGKLPALKDIPDLSSYDVVFVGSPIWYGTYAPPIGTLLNANPLAGKTVAPFCTHGGGGAGRFLADLKKACPDATILKPLVLRGSNQIERKIETGVTVHHTEDSVVSWLNSIF